MVQQKELMSQCSLLQWRQKRAVSASDILKRNTDSLRCAVENDVFASLPQDSLLDELEMGWVDENKRLLFHA